MNKQFKKALWAEIVQLEQHYKRNQYQIDVIVQKNVDISGRIQNKLMKLNN